MQFQHPNFLWAFLALAVPILIHLFNLRRHKTVYFSDIRFLKNVQQATKKQRTLKDLLVLLARMLALAALVLAFAKPYLPVSENQLGTENVVIYLDNSPSTTAGQNELSPLERAKQMALAALKDLPANAKIALQTASSTGKPSFATKQEIEKQIKNITAVDLPMQFASSAEKTTNFLFTDLQKNNLPNFASDSATWVVVPTVQPNETTLNNLAIDSVWIENPIMLAGETVTLFIQLKNYGLKKQTATIEVLTNNLPEAQLAADVSPNTDTVVTVGVTQLSSSFNQVRIQLKNDAVQFDNQNTQTYFIPLANNVVEIYQEQNNPLIQRIFSGSEFNFTAMPAAAINPQVLAQADLIIANQLTEVKSGLTSILQESSNTANIFIIPPQNNAQQSAQLAQQLTGLQFGSTDTAKLNTQTINTEDRFFKNVFTGELKDVYWPTVNKHYRLRGTAALPQFNLLTLANGNPLFVRIAKQKTNVFLLSVPLAPSYSDLASHPIIVPLFIKALVKEDNIGNFTGVVGQPKSFVLPLANNQEKLPVHVLANKHEIIPRQQLTNQQAKLSFGQEITHSGTYTFVHNQQEIGKTSFNITQHESNLARYTPAEIKTLAEQNNWKKVHVLEATNQTISAQIAEMEQGKQLYKYALFLALIFILLEVSLLRFLK